MKKTKAFIVNSSDLFKSGNLSVKAARDNPNIEKRCPVCNSVLIRADILEHGEKEEGLYCPTCKPDTWDGPF